MSALARELVEQLQQLTEDQQRKVLEFARTLRDQSAATDWENQPWTEAEIREMMKPNPKTGAELAAMIEQMQPIEFVDPDITDPVEWVRVQREKDEKRIHQLWQDES